VDQTPTPAARGGRRAAEQRLAAIDPARYGASRNHLDGAVTRLSPYIRHGVLSLTEVRQEVFARLEAMAGPETVVQPDLFAAAGAAAPRWSSAQRRAGEKLISELGWRDYWQRLWRQLGDGIWIDREPLKTGHAASTYATALPSDLAAASTGLACIDAFATELMATGWLHNHARMWLGSYVLHWRRVRWQAGARWFLQHLLDGDPASNNLSWQWLASSFSHKPYLFNRANLERFGGGRHCAACPAAGRGGAGTPGGCPFEASYEALQERLFRPLVPGDRPSPPAGARAPRGDGPGATAVVSSPWRPGASGAASGPGLDPVRPGGPDAAVLAAAAATATPLQRPLVWVHEEALGPANPALLAHPGAPALAVLDADWIAGRAPLGNPAAGGAMAGRGARASAADPPWGELPPAAGRIRFLRECLAELPVTVRQGDVAAELLAAAAALGADGIVSSRPVDPRLQRIAARLARVLPLRLLEPEPFVALPFEGPGAPELRRFSRYWRQAEPLLWG
jgi:deoxyribodipyrimidine photo-lyase